MELLFVFRQLSCFLSQNVIYNWTHWNSILTSRLMEFKYHIYISLSHWLIFREIHWTHRHIYDLENKYQSAIHLKLQKK